MATPSILRKAAMATVFLATIPVQTTVGAVDLASGFSMDRLSAKQIRIWREIQRIVLAADRTGRPLHPILQCLWQRVQSTGHTLCIEMMEHRVTSRIAGKTTLEKTDSDGNRKVIKIWLNLWAIDNAFVNPTVRRADGLIPFDRLGKYERYAEVLGHELTHGVLMLENPVYARLCSEYDWKSAELLVMRSGGHTASAEVTGRQLRQLQSLAERIERPAEAAELEIWRELRSGQRHRMCR